MATTQRLLGRLLLGLLLASVPAAGLDAAPVAPAAAGNPGVTLRGALNPAPIAFPEEPHEHKPEEEPTTEETTEETTTGPPKSPVPIVEELLNAVFNELRHGTYQWACALIAAVAGGLTLWDGEKVFRYLVLGVIFMVVYIMSVNQVSAVWETDPDSTVVKVIGYEVAGVSAFCAHHGFEGVRLFTGVLLGFLLALGLQGFAVKHGQDYMDNRWVVTVFFSVSIIGLMILFKRRGHELILVVGGGALVTSAVAYGLTELAVLGKLDFLSSVLPGLTPKSGDWFDYLKMLLSPSSPDFGIFADSKYNPVVAGTEWPLDRILGYFWWALLSYIGYRVHRRRHRLVKEAEAREPALREPLLQ